MEEGVVYHIVVTQFGLLPMHMHSQITEIDLPRSFKDCQLHGKGPFKSWCHKHEFSMLNEHSTLITDTVTYTLPLGPVGRFVDTLIVRRQVTDLFSYRHMITLSDLEQK